MTEPLKLANERSDGLGVLHDIQTEAGRHVCMAREAHAKRLVAGWNHCEQLADRLQDMVDRMEVFIESGMADEQDQEAYDAGRHAVNQFRKEVPRG